MLQAFSEALGQKPDVFAPIYRNGPNQLLKIVRYPGRDQTDSDQGVGAHKDGGFVTILLQDVVGGLQVEMAMAAGSSARRAAGPSSSISAKCWSWPRTAISRPRSIAW